MPEISGGRYIPLDRASAEDPLNAVAPAISSTPFGCQRLISTTGNPASFQAIIPALRSEPVSGTDERPGMAQEMQVVQHDEIDEQGTTDQQVQHRP